MVTAYRAIQGAECGPISVWLAQDERNQLAYLVAPADALSSNEFGSASHLPMALGLAEVEGVGCRVLEVPNGVSLEQFKSTITEQGILDVLDALVSGLTAVEAAGIPFPTGLVDERMLILDQSGVWRFDFVAACLAGLDNQAAGLTTPAGDVTRLFFGLLAGTRLGSPSRILRALERNCRVGPPSSVKEWRALLTKVQQPPRIPISHRLAVVGVAALITVIVGLKLVYGHHDVKSDAPAMPETVPVAVTGPETEPPPEVAPAENVASNVKPSPTAVSEIPGPVHDVLPGFPASWRSADYVVPKEEEPTADTSATTAPPPPLPGPYCESEGANTAGSTRYLVVGGERVCTAHLLFWNQTYISYDAVARVAYTEVGALPDDEYVKAYGRLWIAVRQSSLNRFGLQIDGIDSRNVYVSRR